MKVWHLPEEERLSESITTLTHTATLPGQEKRVETVAWNPVASGVLAGAEFHSVKIFDIEAGVEKIGEVTVVEILYITPYRPLFSNYCAFDIFQKVIFLLEVLHRRSKFAKFGHALMQNHLS